MNTATLIVEQFYGALCRHDVAAARALLADDAHFHIAHPVNDLAGPEAYFSSFWEPLARALPNLEYRPFVRVAGDYDGFALDGDGAAGQWVNTTGYIAGAFVAPLFGIPATGRPLYLRFGELIRVADGRIAELYMIPDFLDAMVQAGVSPLRRALGHDGLVLPPMGTDGVVRASDNGSGAAKSLKLVLDMLDGLARFDGKSLLSMDQERYWHPDFMWFGPAGIGATRGLSGFREHHQGPFLVAFPTRAVDRTKSLVADGDYIATGGWPHMSAVHLGGGWLGLAPTGRQLTMRVMDFWRREGDLLRENWVSIDMPHVLDQLGLDLFDQMKQLLLPVAR